MNLPLILRLFGTICILAGLSHVLGGLNADALLGANPPQEALSNASMDSQNRFYGAAFMLYGVLSWLCASNMRHYAAVFRLLILVFFIGGLTRLTSLMIHGLPSPAIQFLALTELLIPPLLLWWHKRAAL